MYKRGNPHYSSLIVTPCIIKRSARICLFFWFRLLKAIMANSSSLYLPWNARMAPLIPAWLKQLTKSQQTKQGEMKSLLSICYGNCKYNQQSVCSLDTSSYDLKSCQSAIISFAVTPSTQQSVVNSRNKNFMGRAAAGVEWVTL